MSCGDGSGHQLDTGFGAGWSNNLNEGTVQNHTVYPLARNVRPKTLVRSQGKIWLKTAKRTTFGENIGYLYGP